MDNRPIGIFDSGSGGLTVVDKIFRILPHENIVYFGDTARVPYGNKSKDTITRFSKEITKFLLKAKVKLIIVACNTASSLSLSALERSFSVPIIGVIKPGVEEALKESKNKKIAIIGTDATIRSKAYEKEIKILSPKAFVVQKSCPLFVPLVETNWLNDRITLDVARRYLNPISKKKIDTLILGCTHYPLLKRLIKRVVGKKVKLIDSSTSVAKCAKKLLEKENMSGNNKKPKIKFFTSDNAENFIQLAKIFLNKNIKAKKVTL